MSSNPSLRPPFVSWLMATALLSGSVALSLQDLMRSNRPHELQNAPWVAALTALGLAICAVALVGLVRYASARPGKGTRRPAFLVLASSLALVAGSNGVLLVGAASVLPDVLAR